MGFKPLVSVIVPCHDQGRFLPETIASVRQQTYPNIEIIIVDDGSKTDPAGVALSNIGADQIGVKLYRHEVRQGAAAARNTAIKHAQGELIFPLDADDLMDAYHLEKTVAALENPKNSCVYTDLQIFGDMEYISKTTVSLVSALACEPVPICTLYRRQVYDTIGGYKEHITIGEDSDFAIRALIHDFNYAYVEEPLYLYRKHGASHSAQCKDIRLREIRTIWQEHKDQLIENLFEVLLFKENRYQKQEDNLKHEYTHLHAEFHKLLNYAKQIEAELKLPPPAGIRAAWNKLIESMYARGSKMARLTRSID